MYKESWGLKRICPLCSKQYYDLGRSELECPECEKEIEVGGEVTVNGYTSCSDCKVLYDNLTKEI